MFRAAHWVREQVKAMLSSPIETLGRDAYRGCSLLLKEIDALIVSSPAFTFDRALINSTPGVLRALAAI